METSEPESSGWFAVRCIFATGWPPEARDKTYEERITLWKAQSGEEAIARAEAEALEYASSVLDSPSTYLGFAESFRLEAPPGDGTEVFSLMRDSGLGPVDYLARFFATGAERVQHLE
jgi:hypothetical protein